ncbi:hypothetical protein KSP35_07665 [Aquihabitans sp. G128]|uniref:hypothetical protein n=1 Tax=Aquihabitans sp. G128 TaxID=2849779 RepID=UPI001C24A327|nr:hypothetical protein [Aquihabitans sp. G128]QXC62662.1 hypothetical protein KSP35_07665 [Aquihabitans sp. G128]
MISRATPTRILLLAVALATASALGGCSGSGSDDAAPATTEAPDATTTAPAATTSEAPTTTAGSSSTTAGAAGGEVELTRADARIVAAGAAMDEAASVAGAEQYFADVEEVTCSAPDAPDATNLNQTAASWDCTLDSEVNGARCAGSVTVVATGTEDDPEGEATGPDIACTAA